MRRALAVLALGSVVAGLAGCGGHFPLPTESRRPIPSDKSYQMVATWTGMDGIRDIVLTQGGGTQLFLLFNQGGVGTAPRGAVGVYARLKPTGPQSSVPDIAFHQLFNPVGVAVGGDGGAGTANRVFVLDQGDTCLARSNPTSGSCSDTTGKWTNEVRDLAVYWHVREYGLLGGDTMTTFTDTSMAFVNGIAADAQGRVYVSGAAVLYVSDPIDPRLKTRAFLWRVNRYLRGPKGPGVYDLYMPGSPHWHRDTAWVVADGSGIGTVQDPRGIFWSPNGGGALYAADFGKNWVQKLSDQISSTGEFNIDGSTSPGGLLFLGPVDVVADLQGFIYVVDAGNQRVLRYDGAGAYVQDVNVETDAFHNKLKDPVCVAADDSLVFVGDPGRAEVIRYYKRRL